MTFRLPAEWHPQSAIMLTWPHQGTDWQPWLTEIQNTYLNIIAQVSRFQSVVVACHDEQNKRFLGQQLNDLPLAHPVHLFIAPSDDTWARDHGPITLVNDQGETKILDFTFNAWGDKYQANLDDKITQALIQQPFVQLQQYQNIDFVLEGGSIESDGRGSLLTTEICLLNPNRNPDLKKSDIEATLKTLFKVSNVIWLSQGHLPGDDTDAHIDTLARFTPTGIAYVTSEDHSDPSYAALKVMESELIAARDIDGQPYTLFPLPSPAPIMNVEGEPLPATYANFLIINQAVLVPTYQDRNDQLALDVLQRAFPEHQIIGIDCRTVIQQFGSLHCLTMQLPQGLIHG